MSLTQDDMVFAAEQSHEAVYKPRARKVMPRDLKVGDLLVKDHGKTEKITTLEHWACSKYDTHVNGRDCYSYHIPVTILA